MPADLGRTTSRDPRCCVRPHPAPLRVRLPKAAADRRSTQWHGLRNRAPAGRSPPLGRRDHESRISWFVLAERLVSRYHAARVQPPSVTLDRLATCPCTQFTTEIRILRKSADRICERSNVTRLDQQRSPTVLENVADLSEAARNDRLGGGHVFEQL